MKSFLYHIDIRVSNFRRSFPFYRALFRRLGWNEIDSGKDYCGYSDGRSGIWVIEAESKYRRPPFHRKRTGLNHIAFRVPGRAAVDEFHRKFLRPKRIKILYGGPKEYPEYYTGYYAVFFEDPDRIKLEVAHIPGRH